MVFRFFEPPVTDPLNIDYREMRLIHHGLSWELAKIRGTLFGVLITRTLLSRYYNIRVPYFRKLPNEPRQSPTCPIDPLKGPLKEPL